MSIEPDAVADILVLNALNWSYSEIAQEVGVSESTVGEYVNQAEDESKATGADPHAVFLSYYIEGQGKRVADYILQM